MNYEKMWYQLKQGLMENKKPQIVNLMNSIEISESASKRIVITEKEKKIGFTE